MKQSWIMFLLIGMMVVMMNILKIVESTIIEPVEELQHHGRCEAIRIPLCHNLPYNETMMPNHLRHAKQEDAGLELHQYVALIKVNCSPDLRFFLCLMFAPVCTVLDKPLLPCRSICESARNGCEGIMKNFGYPWPPSFECEKLPEFGDGPNVICVGMNKSSSSSLSTTPSSSSLSLTSSSSSIKPYYSPAPPEFSGGDGINSWQKSGFAITGARDIGFICPLHFHVPPEHGYTLHVGDKIVSDCGAPCDGMFFSENERQFAKLWIGSWATLCAASCFFTFLTFLIDTNRFRYPERPIIYLSVCYMMVSLVYVIGWIADKDIACQAPFLNDQHPQARMVSTITQGTKYPMCSFLFMTLYFFGMASSIWWIILALTWFLAAGLKWGNEAIEAHYEYYHFFAWSIPTILTVVISAKGKIEGDVLSGVCYVGLWNVETLRLFVLAPLCIFLVLGTIFLFAGFVSLFRIRTVMKHDGTKTDKLEKLMIRIGIFSVLYTVPALSVIACLIYEQAYFDSWMTTWHNEMCSKNAYSIPCTMNPQKRKINSHPIFAIFMIKYLMAMVVGFTSSVWVCSSKTLTSWRKFINHIRGRRVEAYV
ncbi:frizzled-2 [Aphidius gifuensis]|uniref:frizzled-2 n=1 Tax=Aphidius gifuensis TaxID=684658 RepID=UPI001CDD0970|nr:frizzled-2 [Aphidius gifuensis]